MLSAVVLGVLYTAGVAFRVVGPLFALTLLIVTTYRSSWGQLLWFDNLMVLHIVVVGFASAADAYVPGRIRRSAIAEDTRYGWPVRLAACITVSTYALAGIAKLRIGGIAWLDGESLRNHVAYSAARLRVLGGTPSPLAAPLMEQLWLFTPLAIATLADRVGRAGSAVVRPSAVDLGCRRGGHARCDRRDDVRRVPVPAHADRLRAAVRPRTPAGAMRSSRGPKSIAERVLALRVADHAGTGPVVERRIGRDIAGRSDNSLRMVTR